MTWASYAQVGDPRQVGTIPRVIRDPVARDKSKLVEKMWQDMELMWLDQDRPAKWALGARRTGVRMRGGLGVGAPSSSRCGSVGALQS